MSTEPTMDKRAFTDSLMSMVTGIGAGQRSVQNSAFWVTPTVDKAQMIAAYRGDWMSRKIVDIPAFDMTRNWRIWDADKAVVAQVEKEERRLKVRAKVNRAIRLARLFGGSVILISDGAADPSLPLDPAKIGQGGVKWIQAMTRYEITAGEIDVDPTSDGFGEPAYYLLDVNRLSIAAASAFKVFPNAGTLQRGGTVHPAGTLEIHPSRVIRFLGNELPETTTLTAADNGWGDSVLVAVVDALKQAQQALQGVSDLIPEAKTDVISVEGLTAAARTKDKEDQIIRRFEIAAMAKTLTGITILDTKEVYDRKQINFSGVEGVTQTFLSVVCAAADIPATRFLSTSPKGMNATGESDSRNYYDMLGSRQEMELRPALEKLDSFMFPSATGRVANDNESFEFAPLWQLTLVEKATIALQKAQTTVAYVGTGLVPDEAMALGVRNQLVEDGTYPGLGDEWDGTPPPEPEPVDPALLNQPPAANQNEQAKAAGAGLVAGLRQAKAANDQAEVQRLLADFGVKVRSGHPFADAMGAAIVQAFPAQAAA